MLWLILILCLAIWELFALANCLDNRLEQRRINRKWDREFKLQQRQKLEQAWNKMQQEQANFTE